MPLNNRELNNQRQQRIKHTNDIALIIATHTVTNALQRYKLHYGPLGSMACYSSSEAIGEKLSLALQVDHRKCYVYMTQVRCTIVHMYIIRHLDIGTRNSL